MLFTLLLFMSFSSCFGQEQGYAVFDSSTGTFTFTCSKPTVGTLGKDYWITDNTGDGDPGWYGNRTSITKVVFESSYTNTRPLKCTSWFKNFVNLKEIEGIENLKTENVTNMESMFESCSRLESLDVSAFETKAVKNMAAMFAECKKLTFLNVSRFDTREVEYMHAMFSGCTNLSSLNVSNFNTNKVKFMNNMFKDCKSLSTLDVSHFKTVNVQNMSFMFSGCRGLSYLDVSGFATDNVTSMDYMFYDCNSLSSLDVSGFATNNVTSMGYMFYDCGRLSSLEVGGFVTDNVTDMSYMFAGCSGLSSLDMSGFSTKKVTDMSYMFYKCSALTSLTFVEKFTTPNCQRFENMFYGCYKMRFLDFYASNDDNTHAFKEANLNRNGASSTVLFGKEGKGLPLTTVIYMPHGISKSDYTNYTDLPNLVFNDGGTLKAANYYSEDKVDIELPREFKTAKAEYSRTMNAATQYGTVILPYEFTTNESVQAYLLRAEHTGTMWYEEVESVPAHTPFFYSKKTASNTNVNFNKTVANYGITVEATHTTSNAEDGQPYDAASGMDGWTTKGYYITETVDARSGNTYYISGDKFWRATGTLKMYPHRVTYQGQWQYDPDATEAPAMFNVITMGASETGDDLPSEVSTAIEAAHLRSLQQNARDIYDAQGRRQSELKSGLNIVRMADGTTVKIVKR